MTDKEIGICGICGDASESCNCCEVNNDCNCDREDCFTCEGKWQDAADLDNFGTE